MNITELKKEIHQTAKEKGFWNDDDRNIGELLMLCVSELSEALEADRKNKYADLETYEDFPTDNYFDGELDYQRKLHFESEIKDTFEDEIADTIIRLLDLCKGLDIPIEKHMRYKLDYNKTRDKKHGKKY